MEDFFFCEDPAGSADAYGVMDISGNTVTFSASAYGSRWRIEINGKQLPAIIADYEISYDGQSAPISPDDPAGKIVARLEELARMAAELPEDPILKIAAEIPEPEQLADEDEFEDDSMLPVVSHVKDGRKIRVDVNINDERGSMATIRDLYQNR